ncbi:MAG TPA: DMT family transporter [Bacteroidales bacterium]|nr:DMT family transporter [Bacteroidales bacterium]
MINLALSIIFSTAILILFRLLKPLAGSILQVITINYLVATLLGIATSEQSLSHGLMQWPAWTPIAIVLGFLFIATFFLFARSSQQAGVAITAVASRMSVLIPVLGGLLIFGEKAGISRLMGFALVFPAFYYTLYNGDSGKSVWYNRQALLPLALLLGTGLNDLLMNLATRAYAPVDLPFMLSIIFSISFLIGSAVLSISIIQSRLSFRLSLIPYGVLLGLINYASTYFLLRSMNQFDASLLFPVVNASIVFLAALVDISFFGHRPNRRQMAGMALALVAIVLISRG